MTENTTITWRPRWHVASARRRALAALTALALAWSMLLAFTAPSLAAPGTRVNVDPEQLQVAVGATVVLTAEVRDALGNPSVGEESNTHVRWFFTSTSPNSPHSPGNSPDLQCWTGSAGSCSVSYVAVNLGTDQVCAVVSGSVHRCDEEVVAPEWDNHSDAVERVVTTGPVPTPTPVPTPDPTPLPTPDPTPVPTADPTPVPTPDPTPVPTPVPTPDPTPVPTPDPTPVPTPDPTPDPRPVQAPDPTPDPTPVPAAPMPTGPSGPEPVPQPEPEPGPVTAPVPVPEPADTSPDPAAEPPLPAPPIVEELSAPAPIGRLNPSPLEPAVGVVPGAAAAPVVPPAAAVPPIEINPFAPTGVVAQVLAAAITGVASVVRPEAAVALAEEFTFPITLTVSVLAFLAVQGHIDRRDPKLRLAPQHVVETVVHFEPEEDL